MTILYLSLLHLVDNKKPLGSRYNILMDNTFKGIYVKMDNNGHRVQDLLYQNITIRGPTVEAPVMIGPINQFAGGCPWSWPMLPGSECAAYSSSDVSVTIDGLRVTECGGFPLRRSASSTGPPHSCNGCRCAYVPRR